MRKLRPGSVKCLVLGSHIKSEAELELELRSLLLDSAFLGVGLCNKEQTRLGHWLPLNCPSGLSFLVCKRGMGKKEFGGQDSSEFAPVQTLLSFPSWPRSPLALRCLLGPHLLPSPPSQGWWGWEDKWEAGHRDMESTCLFRVPGPQPITRSSARSHVEGCGQGPQGKGWWGRGRRECITDEFGNQMGSELPTHSLKSLYTPSSTILVF